MECGESDCLRRGRRACCCADYVGVAGASKRASAWGSYSKPGLAEAGRCERSKPGFAGAHTNLSKDTRAIAARNGSIKRSLEEKRFPGQHARRGVERASFRIGFLAGQARHANGGRVMLRNQTLIPPFQR